MKTSDYGWWSAAISLSLLLHILVVARWSDNNLTIPAKALPGPQFSQVRLLFPAPRIAQLEAEPEPITKPEPEPESKPEPSPKLRPEPKREAKPPPKPKPKPKVKPMASQETVKVMEPTAPSMPKAAVHKQVVEAPVLPSNRRDIRKHYLASLLAHIEERKFYPKIARRRNIEGLIRVSFNLGCDGIVTQLEAAGGHKLLRKSAERAVKTAQPLPEQPEGMECPLSVSYAMAFKLH